MASLLLGVSYLLGKCVGYGVAIFRTALRQRAVNHVRQYLWHASLDQPKQHPLRLAMQALSNAGVSVCDTLLLWALPYRWTQRWVTVSGWDRVLALQASTPNMGTLFLTPHLGCFEMAGLWIGHQQPITSMYRPPRQPWLDRWMRSGRQAGRVSLVPADLKGVRAFLKALKKGESVGMLPDQVPRHGEGVWVPFFGRPAYTMTLLARLQQQTQAHCVWVVAERRPWMSGIHLHFHVMPSMDAKALTTEQAVTQMNQTLEGLIRRYPEQYMWGYNRYKTQKAACDNIVSMKVGYAKMR
jgi:Kdo2-lipid IVA lauroyltransferase/acyltransferase